MKCLLVMLFALSISAVPVSSSPFGPALPHNSSQFDHAVDQEVIAEIQIHGNRHVPIEKIKALVSSRPGDVYDQKNLDNDVKSLTNSGYFEDVRFEREQSQRGWIVHFYLKEKPAIRDYLNKGNDRHTIHYPEKPE